MPRANRHFVPGLIWHITHRCHEKAFLLKFTRDRNRWMHWLFEAKKRHGLCVLNYVATSNHIHLLVKDTGEQVIPRSMQLIAGRTAQEYNRRKKRKGAFWEDRYHATAVSSDGHLVRCLVYIDLNMVRAGMVRHPANWRHGGYREIERLPSRYRIIDTDGLLELLGIQRLDSLQQQRRQWVNDELALNRLERNPAWSESLAVGNESFVKDIQAVLGIRARHRDVDAAEDKYILRESQKAYRPQFESESNGLSFDNRFWWDND